MSQATKRALAASLKGLLARKPLSKITISDITEDCGISRMTFYYHFQDVYDLIDWICQEVYPAVKKDGITNQRVTIQYNCISAFEVPDRRSLPERDILLGPRKGVALCYAPAHILSINSEIGNAEYHQKTLSDPLIILRMEGVVKIDILDRQDCCKRTTQRPFWAAR